LLHNSITQIQTQTGVRVTTFIPPYNAWNSATLTAMTQNGMNLISSEEDLDVTRTDVNCTRPPFHFPIGADTSFTDASYEIYYPQSPDIVYNEIVAQIARAGYAAGKYLEIFLIFSHDSPDGIPLLG
jgi:hypothetical protein